ncbi:MAG: hypothetical protein Kow0042_09430 [Calditrichia bacterium]
MKTSEMQQLIDSIPGNLWEEQLSLGEFREVQIETISNRKYSIVARCIVRGSTSESRVYVKHYLNKKNLPPDSFREVLENEYQILARYYEKFTRSDNFRVVEPLFVVSDKFLLITREAEGQNLAQLIKSEGGFFPSKAKMRRLTDGLKRTGSWLKYYHSLEKPSPNKYSVDELLEYMKVRFNILTEDSRRRFPQHYVPRILEFVERNRYAVTEEELTVFPSHSDFNLGNVLINDGQVTVLDFGRIKEDSFLLDLSRLYHQLFLMTLKPQYRAEVIRKLQKALLRGYGMEYADRLMLFRFLLIRHTLTHLVGITRYWQVKSKERLYNYWVLYRELNYLNKLLRL